LQLVFSVGAACEIIHRLRQMGDLIRARGVQQYFKHEAKALGITTPELRDFVGERSKALRKT
jgi:hypothetical protein